MRRTVGLVLGAVTLAGATACAASTDPAGAPAPSASTTRTTTDMPVLPPSSEPPATDCPTQAPRLPTFPTTTDAAGHTTLPLSDNRAPLVAVDAADGSVRWRVCPGAWAFSAATVHDGFVWVRGRSFNVGPYPCGNPTDPMLLALDASTGAVVWAADDQRAWSFYDDPPTPDTTAGVVVVDDNGVHALDAVTGAERWAATGNSVIEDGARVYVSTGDTRGTWHDRASGAVLGADAPPTTQPRTRGLPDRSSMADDRGALATVTNSSVRLTGPDGTQRWSVTVPFAKEVAGMTGDTVYVAGATHIGNCP